MLSAIMASAEVRKYARKARWRSAANDCPEGAYCLLLSSLKFGFRVGISALGGRILQPREDVRLHTLKYTDTLWRDHYFRGLSLIHISEPTRLGMISYAVF